MKNSNAFLAKEKLAIGETATVAIGPGAGASVHNSDDRLSINVIRENGQVQFLEVQCDCGKITRIICEYV